MALACAPGVFLGVVLGALAAGASPGPSAGIVATSGAEVHVVLQIHTAPSFANDSILVQSSQLTFECASVVYETLQGGSTSSPRTSPNSITVILDSDGNADLTVDAVNCAPGSAIVEADLVAAPYYTATATLKIAPPGVMKPGLTVDPNPEVETGQTPATGESDVYAVFTVSANPVYAGQQVEISSAQLDDRCGQGWRWEPNGGAAVSGVPPAMGDAISTLDDDGNAAFVFKGASCASGPSTIIADVLAGSHPTYTTTFKIKPPTSKAVKKKRGVPEAAKNTVPVTLSLSPTPVTEIGFTASGDLSITKTDNLGGSSVTSTPGTAVPGTSITYTIVASNSGPTVATGASVTDALALNPDIESDTWTATGSGNATGFTASGSGNISDSLDLPAGGSVTYTVVATIQSSAMGILSNTATITPPPGFSDINPGDNSAIDTDTLKPSDDLSITKTDNDHGSVTAGTPITYTIVVSDGGPSDTSHLAVVDNLPAQGLTNVSSPNLPPDVTFSPSTDSWSMASLSTGQSVTLQLAGTVPSGATGTSYTNTATASASDASPVTATDTDALNVQAALAISNTDGVSSVVAGSSDTYTTVVSNSGPSDAANLSVVDAVPTQGLSGISSPGLPSGVTFNSGTDTWSLSSLPAGQAVTLKLSGTIPPGATGASYANTATASSSDAATVSATDTDTLTAKSNLNITNSDGVSSVVAGTSDTYTVVVTNTGPSNASALSVVDALPTQGLTNISSPGLPSGVTFTSATDTWSLASLAAGQSVTLELAGTVPSGATGSTYADIATASATDATTVTATDTDTLTAHATLAITKTDSDGGSSATSTKGTAVPGTSITYTIVASNTGPSNTSGATVTDPLALNPAIASDTWTATGSGGATGFSPTGSGSINDSVAIPAGGSITYTVTASLRSSATGTLSNTATAAATDATTVTATDTDTVTAQSTLTITNSDGVSSVVAGTPDTYTVVVTNTGPSNASALSVVDTLPTQGFTGITSPSLPTGVTFTSATDTWSLASLAAGQSVTLELAGTVPSGATGSTFADTATASAADASAVSATDTDTLSSNATLTITNSDGVSSVVAGTSDTYTVVVTNTGPSNASALSVVDTLPTQGLTNISSPGLPSGVTFTSATDTWSLASLAAGQSVTLELAGTVPSGATGSTYADTATASAIDATSVSATDTDTLSLNATLAITKTDNDGGSSVTSTKGTAVPGTSITYTIVASNSGPSIASGASVTDPLALNPDIASDTWTATGSGGATGFSATGSGSINDSVTIPAGGSLTYTVVATLYSSATGTLSNTATAAATDATTVTATDTDTLTAHATLAITKTDSDGGSSATSTKGTAVPGTSITYTIVASNTGPSNTSGATVTDPLALNPAIASDTWTATGSGGATGFSPTGSGSINDSVAIPAGGSITYTVTASLRSSATGTLSNTATAAATDATTVTATDTDTLTAQSTLTITNSDGVSSVVAGTPDTYTVVVTNTGPSNASALSVVDTLPTQGFTGITSPSLPTGVTFTSATDTWSLASLAAGQSVTLELAGTVPSGATGSTFADTATASAADASAVSATDTDTLSSNATLTVTKTDSDGGSSVTSAVGTAVPGTSITYTIVASNTGPSTAFNLNVVDTLPTQGLTNVSSPSLPSGVTFTASTDTWTLASLAAGHSVTLELTGTVPSGATGTSYTNTAMAMASDGSSVTATDNDVLSPKATLAVTKTDNVGGSSVTSTKGAAVPGGSITYTIVASNSGPSSTSGAQIADPLALNSSIGSDSWTATGSGGSSGFSPSGSGSIDDPVVIPVGGAVTYTVVANLLSSATGTLANTATVTASDASSVTATDTDTLNAKANLSVTNTDGVSSVVAGTPDTYTVVVSNSGPSDASNLSVADAVPVQGFTGVTSPSLPSGVTFTSATDTWSVASLAAGQSVTLELAGTIPPGAAGTSYVDKATASAGDASSVSATDSDTLTAQATLTISNSDGVSSVIAGTSDTYTVVVTNTGPSNASSLSVVDTIPTQGLTNISSPSLPSGVIFNSTTDTWTLASLAAGQSVTLELAGTVPSGATGSTYADTATASVTDATSVSATDTDTLTAQATLAMIKTDNDGGSSVTSALGTAVAGTSITYTIVDSNTGPSTAYGGSVTDPLALNPAISSDSWTATGSGGATGYSPSGSGNISDAVTIPAGGSITYSVTANIYSSAAGTLSNTATASASDATTISATDTDILGSRATLAITKTDSDGGSSVTSTKGTAVPGTSITYTIVASNSGPSTASGASVTDPLALNPAISSDTWTATGSGGATGFSATGSGNINDSVTIPAGGSITYTVVATLYSSATGTLSNTATAAATDATTVTATDTDTLNPHATLAITKTDSDGGSSATSTKGTAVPGTSITYTIVASNSGPSDASALSVVDTLPTQGFTGITSPSLPTGVTFTSATDTWTLASLAAGQSVTLELAGTVPSGATGTTYADTATASATDASSVSATDTDTLSAQATLTITNSDGVSSVVAGTADTYTVVVTNSGPSNASALSVVDTLPTQGFTGITSPSLPSGVTFNSGTDTWSLASLAAGQSVTLELAGTVPSGATGTTYADTATASATDATSVSATDTDTLSLNATLTITKTDNDGGSSVTSTKGTAVPGTSITYTIVASNTGPSTASGASVTDPLALNPDIASDTWTATGSGGATGFSATGSGSINDSVTIPAGGSLTYTVVATLYTSATGTLSNTATAAASDATTVTATDTDTLGPKATLTITNSDGVSSVVAGTADTYTVVVTNSGPSNASALSVVDTLPSQGLTNVSSPGLPTGVTFNAGTDTWSMATLAAGQSVTLELAGTVPSGATDTTYADTATASAADASAVTATDTDTVTAQSTLTITNSDGVSSVVAGTPDTYTVVVTNTGPSNASALSVVDTLPTQGFTGITSPSLPTGVTFTSATDTWSLASLAAGQSVTLELAGTVPSGATGSTFADTATASAADASAVSATDTDTLSSNATLTITNSDGVSSVVAGTSDTYTVVVTNTGPSNASALSVVDTLPTQGLTNISSPGLPSGVTFTSATDTWSLASLAAGQSVTLELAGTVPSGATGSTYADTATASAIDATSVSATDTDTLSLNATLAITKTDNDGGSSVTSTKGTAVPGTSITYTIVASNSGPSIASGASVTDPLALNPDIASDTWTATGSGGATGFSATGSGSINDSVTIPAGGSLTYTVVATLYSSATGTLSNTATAAATDATTVTATDTDTLTAHATLAITKTDSDGGSSATSTKGTAVPGTSITYTIVASNTGPSNTSGATVTDPLALNPAIASDTWTATGSGGATGFSPTGSGSINDSVAIPAGGSITYTVTASLRSSATGTLSNTATAAATDATTVTATDTDTVTAQSTLTITNSDGVSSVVAGTPDTYTVVVTNTGPSNASALSVVDTLPTQGFTGITSPSLPTGVTFTSATDTWSLASLAAGQSVTLELAGTVPSGATGSTFADTATASAADASAVSATDTDTLSSNATLTITNSDGVSSVVAGTSDTYTVVVTNTGPSNASALSVVDTLPTQGLTNISSPSLPSGVTFNSGTDTWSLASLAAGQSVTLELAGTVPSGATGTTYADTATASATDATSVSATDTDTLSLNATLTITKTDNDGGSSVTSTKGTAVPGTSITYTIVASNTGPSTASGASVTDPLALNPDIASDTWTATGSGGATGFSATGSGSINDSVTIPAGGSLTYTVVATLYSSATGTLSNTATAAATDATTVTATDTDTLTAHATLAITKTDSDGGSSATSTKGTAVPGTSITYTIVASNTGPSNTSGATVTDPLALNPAIASDTWTATGSGGATGFSPTGSGSINDSVAIPAGGSITYTVVATLHSSATGTLSNTATAAATDATTVTATDTDTLTAQSTLTITNSDGVSSVVAGTPDTYTVVVTNTGPSNASALSVVDTLPTQGFTGITSPSLPTGVTFTSATDTWSLASLAAGQSVTLELAGTVPSGAAGTTYADTATASAADASAVSATDSDTLSSNATLTITKTDSDGGSSVTSAVGTAVPGTSITYTIVASNTGPSNTSGATVTDLLALNPAISSDTWTAAGSGGATGFSPTGSGSINDSVTIPSGGSITYTVVATLYPSATGTLTNTATAAATDATTVTATDTDTLNAKADLTITDTDGVSAIVAGTSDVYSIVVTNAGPASALNLSVVDTLPAQGLTNISSPSLPTGVTFTSATDTWTLASLAAGQSVTLELAGTVPSGATGSTFADTATASAADASTVTATDTDTLSSNAALTITNTDGVSAIVAGTSDTYTVAVTNTGPSNASDLSVVDTLPTQGFTNISSPNLPAGVTFTSATDTWTLASLAAGQTVTLELAGSVPSGATGSTFADTATASAADASAVSATDTDTLNAQATLSITNTDGVSSLVAGTSDTYTIVVANTGLSSAFALSVVATLPTQGLTNISSPNLPTGVTFNSGTGTWSLASLATGQSVTLDLAGTVPSGATGSTYVDTATASATDAATVTATDTDTLEYQGDLTTSMTDNDGGSSTAPSTGTAAPGASITYTAVVSNVGPSDVTGAEIYDPLSEIDNLSSDTWSATGSGGATGFTPSGSGSIDDFVTIPAGGSVTYTIVATIASSATGTLSNTVSLTPPSDFTNTNPLANVEGAVGATDSDTLAHAVLTITDTDGASSVGAGDDDTYTIVVTNTGPSSATNLSVVDTLPTQGLTNISSPSLPTGVIFDAGTDTWSLASLAPGQSVTVELAGTVPIGATGTTYSDTATASASDASSVSATDTDSLGDEGDVTIIMNDDDGGSSIVPTSGTAAAGSSITYTITVSNAGPSSVSGAEIYDPVSVHHALTTDTWTATGTGGASGYSPSGSGSIDDIVAIPSGASITYIVVATIGSGASGTLSNTVTLTPPVDFTNTNPLADTGGAVSATDTDTITPS